MTFCLYFPKVGRELTWADLGEKVMSNVHTPVVLYAALTIVIKDPILLQLVDADSFHICGG